MRINNHSSRQKTSPSSPKKTTQKSDQATLPLSEIHHPLQGRISLKLEKVTPFIQTLLKSLSGQNLKSRLSQQKYQKEQKLDEEVREKKSGIKRREKEKESNFEERLKTHIRSEETKKRL